MNIQRVGLIASIVQTFIATSLSNFHKHVGADTSDMRPYMPFFDDAWAEKKAGLHFSYWQFSSTLLPKIVRV